MAIICCGNHLLWQSSVEVIDVYKKSMLIEAVVICHGDLASRLKNFLCSTQLSMKFILPINVKMPTIVGILTFISRINTLYESLKSRNSYIFQSFSFYEQLKF